MPNKNKKKKSKKNRRNNETDLTGKIKKPTIASPSESIPTTPNSQQKKYWTDRRLMILGIVVAIAMGLLGSWPYLRTKFMSSRQIQSEQLPSGDLKGPKLAITSDSTYQGSVITMNSNAELEKKYSKSEVPIIMNTKVDQKNLPKIKGIPAKLFSNPNFIKNGKVNLNLGGLLLQIPPAVFLKGVNILDPYFFMDFSECPGQKLLAFGVKDDRLYISVEFKDIVDEKTIGIIEFNHWKLFTNDIDFDANDSQLEVRDHQNNIVFSIKYSEDTELSATIELDCYLLGPKGVLVFNSGRLNKVGNQANGFVCFDKKDKNWKQTAQHEIDKFHSKMNHRY